MDESGRMINEPTRAKSHTKCLVAADARKCDSAATVMPASANRIAALSHRSNTTTSRESDSIAVSEFSVFILASSFSGLVDEL